LFLDGYLLLSPEEPNPAAKGHILTKELPLALPASLQKALLSACQQPHHRTLYFRKKKTARQQDSKMGQTDLDLLVEMGFEKPRAELAMKKGGACKVFACITLLDMS
jgi:hypothetical protein